MASGRSVDLDAVNGFENIAVLNVAAQSAFMRAVAQHRIERAPVYRERHHDFEELKAFAVFERQSAQALDIDAFAGENLGKVAVMSPRSHPQMLTT